MATRSTVHIDDPQIFGATAQDSVAQGELGAQKFVYPWIQLHLHIEMFGSRPKKKYIFTGRDSAYSDTSLFKFS